MHPIGTAQGVSSSVPPGHLTSCPGDQNGHLTPRGEVVTKPLIHVLSVGRIEPGTLIRDTFLDARDFRVSFVPDYRELWISSKQHDVHAVVLHNSLCSFELVEAARLIRGRWPSAKILIIRSGQASLDRALYDLRLHSPVRKDVLVEQILSLTHSLQEGGNNGNR